MSLEAVARADYDALFAMMRDYHYELDAYDARTAEQPFDVGRYERALLDDLEDREFWWIVVDGTRAGFALVRTSFDVADLSPLAA